MEKNVNEDVTMVVVPSVNEISGHVNCMVNNSNEIATKSVMIMSLKTYVTLLELCNN